MQAVRSVDTLRAVSPEVFGSARTFLELWPGDTNDDGEVNIADAISVLSHLFAGAGDLPAPFAECGVDPTDDGLDCSEHGACAR